MAGSLANSQFTRHTAILIPPAGAVKLRAALVSGGSESTLGLMVIDDLSVAPPQAAAVLPGNFWPNSTFEAGLNLDQTNGVPTGWVRTGSYLTMCQVSTANFTSATNLLAVIDNDANNYAELEDGAFGAELQQTRRRNLCRYPYSALYSVTNGPMRFTVLFFDGSSNVVGATDFNVSGQSSGWAGTIAGSTFTVETQQVSCPRMLSACVCARDGRARSGQACS